MSRLGKAPIELPSGVTATLSGNTLTVRGPKGEISRNFRDGVAISVEGSTITLSIPENTTDLFIKALWGTYASHARNMVIGVSTGFEKKLILEGVGFKSNVVGTNLELALGFSHPVKVEIPSNLTVTADKNVVSVSGVNKEQVGQFAAYVRSLKKPEPYKGKGFRYEGEIIRRKEGKKNV
jgi:large subunit ribosomal protein L6